MIPSLEMPLQPAAGETATGETAAEETATSKLIRIWQDVLGVDSVEVNQNYFDLGGDSSLGVEMFARIDREFHVKLPLVTLYDAQTIAELERILRAEVAPAGWSPLVAIQASGSRPALYCFHGAGGNVLTYRKLAQHLGPDQPFYGLQCQGLDGNSPPLTTIEEMAALYVKHIRAVQPRGPYFLAGYCMGGTLAYEAAQQLQAAGEAVGLLALLDTMNWSRIPLNLWTRSSHAFQRLGFHAVSFLQLNTRDKAKFAREKIESLRNRIPVWLGFARARFHRSSGAGQITESMLLAHIWKVNDQACWTYTARPYPGTVTDFRPSKQYRVFNKPGLKWEKLAQGGQRVVVLPVYPAGMLVEPFVEHLSAALRNSIDAGNQGASK